MKQPPILFKYSGSKRKIVPLLRTPPVHKRIVEPYLGGGAYSLAHTGPAVGYDVNQDIIDLWHFLQKVKPERIRELESIKQEACKAHPLNKPDARDLRLEKGEETYVRINTSGVYVGQLSSWVLYPKWKCPVEQTISLLDRAREIEVIHGSANGYVQKDGDLVFLDPPYVGTKANYKQQARVGIEESYRPQDTIDLIGRLDCPIIFTYGTDAKTAFPQYEWLEVMRKKVPNIRRGGTVERIEHVAYINWN